MSNEASYVTSNHKADVDSSDEEEDYNDDDDNYSIVSDYAFDFYGSDGVESEYAFDYQEYDSDEDSDSDDGLEDEVVAEPKGNQVVDEAKEVVAEPKKVAQGPAKIRTVEDPWCRFKWPITSNGLRGNYTPAKSVKTFSDWKAVIMEDLQYRFMFFCICGPALFVIHCMLKMY
uniref:DDE_Tnp_1_7 domain-containing protein n=1 Tax=Panagrellus redivivus TaxID=6233 RepID=A0A7E4VQK8_PANRE